ncbi:unnamed protein product [Coregonus sp. 'balchen']|nr:unnamed protein product [Coregonus sp. 'balchen']
MELNNNSLVEEIHSRTPGQCSALAYKLLMSEEVLGEFNMRKYSTTLEGLNLDNVQDVRCTQGLSGVCVYWQAEGTGSFSIWVTFTENSPERTSFDYYYTFYDDSCNISSQINNIHRKYILSHLYTILDMPLFTEPRYPAFKTHKGNPLHPTPSLKRDDTHLSHHNYPFTQRDGTHLSQHNYPFTQRDDTHLSHHNYPFTQRDDTHLSHHNYPFTQRDDTHLSHH